MSRKRIFAIVSAVIAATVVVIVLFQTSRKPCENIPAATVDTASEPPSPVTKLPPDAAPEVTKQPPPVLPPSPSAPSSLGTAERSPADEEAAIMAKLHELEFTDLEQSLEAARDGNDRFPDTKDAAERAWYVVKCLTMLGRFDEAKAEAKIMTERYRGTSFADDVYRHVLAHP